MTTIVTPVVDLDNKEFWDYTAKGELRFQYCIQCDRWIYPIGPVCTSCLGESLEWRPVSGRGVIAAWVTYHRQYYAGFDVPYTVVNVDLEEGIRILGNLSRDGSSPDPEYQAPVTAFLEERGDFWLPQFRRV